MGNISFVLIALMIGIAYNKFLFWSWIREMSPPQNEVLEFPRESAGSDEADADFLENEFDRKFG